MTLVVATQRVWYDGRTREVGEQFDCSDMEAKIMEATNKVNLVKYDPEVGLVKEDDPPTKKTTMVTRELKAEEPMSTESAGEFTGKIRRRYQRRDMTAEDTE